MAKSNKQRFSIIRVVALVFLTFMGYGAAISLAARTMVWFPAVALTSFAVAALLAVAIAVRRGGFIGIRNIVAAASVATLMFAGIIAGTFMTLNYAFAAADTARTERVEVKRKYVEKHYRSKRVSRNRYTRGEPYYEHCIDVEFRNGKVCPVKLGVEKYRRVSRGDTLDATVERGLFGFSVMKNVEI